MKKKLTKRSPVSQAFGPEEALHRRWSTQEQPFLPLLPLSLSSLDEVVCHRCAGSTTQGQPVPNPVFDDDPFCDPVAIGGRTTSSLGPPERNICLIKYVLDQHHHHYFPQLLALATNRLTTDPLSNLSMSVPSTPMPSFWPAMVAGFDETQPQTAFPSLDSASLLCSHRLSLPTFDMSGFLGAGE